MHKNFDLIEAAANAAVGVSCKIAQQMHQLQHQHQHHHQQQHQMIKCPQTNRLCKTKRKTKSKLVQQTKAQSHSAIHPFVCLFVKHSRQICVDTQNFHRKTIRLVYKWARPVKLSIFALLQLLNMVSLFVVVVGAL